MSKQYVSMNFTPTDEGIVVAATGMDDPTVTKTSIVVRDLTDGSVTVDIRYDTAERYTGQIIKQVGEKLRSRDMFYYLGASLEDNIDNVLFKGVAACIIDDTAAKPAFLDNTPEDESDEQEPDISHWPGPE